jgi:spore germination protein (amino acid permease)
MLSLPMALTEVSHQDAWLSFFLPIPYGIFIALLFSILMRKVPEKNIFEISKYACGKWVGGFLNLLLVIYLFYDLVMNLRIYADFFHSSILQRTPVDFIILITVILLIFFGRGTIEELARTAGLFFPIFFILYMFLPIFLLNEIDLTQLQPALASGAEFPMKGGLLGMGAFGDILTLGAFLNNVKSPRGMYISIKCGVIVSCFLLTLWTFLVVSTLGQQTASNIMYIGWILVQQVHITEFLDRIDLFLVSLWLPNLIIKYMVLYLAILTGLASFTKSKSSKEFNLMTGGLATLVTLVSFKNVGEVINFNNYGMMPFSFLIQILLFGSIFTCLLFRKKERMQLLEKWPYGKLIWIMLIGCVLSLSITDVMGHSRGIYGLYSICLYSVFYLLAVFFVVREFKIFRDKE